MNEHPGRLEAVAAFIRDRESVADREPRTDPARLVADLALVTDHIMSNSRYMGEVYDALIRLGTYADALEAASSDAEWVAVNPRTGEVRGMEQARHSLAMGLEGAPLYRLTDGGSS